MDESTVSVFVEGSGDVVTADQWPTIKVEYRPFYLRPRRELSAEPERMGTEHAVPDGFLQAPLTVTDKVEILSWRTEPVVEPVEIFAAGAAHLFGEIDQPDTNLILGLWDEARRGDRQLLTTGFLMASHHELARSAARGRPVPPAHTDGYGRPGAVEECVVMTAPGEQNARPGRWHAQPPTWRLVPSISGTSSSLTSSSYVVP